MKITAHVVLLVAGAAVLLWSASVLAGWFSTGTPAVLDRVAAAIVVLAFLPWHRLR